MSGKVFISRDPEPQNPREWDNTGKLALFHKRYRVANESGLDSRDYDGWDGLDNALIRECRAVVLVPVYMMDHSGLTLSADPEAFRRCDPQGWDWGRLGTAYIDGATLKREWGHLPPGQGRLDAAHRMLQVEVEAYGQYLNGDIWCYRVEDADGEIEDSCGGYFDREQLLADVKPWLDKGYELAEE